MDFISIRKKLLSLSARLLAGAVFVFFFSVAILALYNSNKYIKYIEVQTEKNLIGKGSLLVSNNSIALRRMVEDNAFSDVQEIVVSTVKMDKDIISGIFIDNTGHHWVVATPDQPEGGTRINQKYHESLCKWAVKDSSLSFRKITNGNAESIVFTAPVENDDERLGTILYEITTASTKYAIAVSKREYYFEAIIIFGGMFIIAAILFIVAFITTRRQSNAITAPIDELTNAVNVISRGDYSLPVKIVSNDETGILAQNFETMRQTVKDYTDNLEKKVEERTLELSDTNQALQEAEARTRSLLENSPDYIINTDRNLKVKYINRSRSGIPKEEIIGSSVFDFVAPEDHEKFQNAVVNVFETGRPDMIDSEITPPDGNPTWFESRFAGIKKNDQISEVMIIATDITQRKKAEEKLDSAQKELIEKAHQAGMADIATGTLHNVGNILNSVKTSAQVIGEIIEKTKIAGFIKANSLLRENLDTLEEFILSNPKGKKLMSYYLKLESGITEEQEMITMQVDRLNNKIDAIEEVISAQQSYAGSNSLSEEFSLSDIIEDALTMLSGTISRFNISVIKDYQNIPKIKVQRVKLVHILINLIRNAKDAMLESPAEQRKLKLKVYRDTDATHIVVSDTGSGITQDGLKRIFAHGFTTKSGGHGFGLHSSANYMTEMGGKMWAESEGEGKGTAFILKFPDERVRE